MGLFRRGGVRSGRKADAKAHVQFLSDWAGERRGVEAFVEPKTAVTAVSLLLVAHDGEFTRRVIGTPEAARDFARSRGLPIYDATVVGYPQRMRDWSRKQTILQQRAERDALGG
jgi:hypothetical protein